MLRHFGILLIPLTLTLGLAPALAQEAVPAETQAQADSKLLLELNNATDTEAGACQLTIVATNRMDQGIKRAAWQVAIFDRAGTVQSLPILDFGGMIAGKTRIGMFPLPDRRCGDIGRIIINDVAECSADDGSDLRDICLTGLSTQTRTDIDFGL